MTNPIRAAVFVGLGLLVAPARGGFIVSDLGVLPGGRASQGESINVFGQVSGTAAVDSLHDRAVLGGGSSLSSLGTLPGGDSSAGHGINDDGLICGESSGTFTRADGSIGIRTTAFRSNGGQLDDLRVSPGDSGSVAYAINASGTVAGAGLRADGSTHAVTATGKDAFTDLGSLGGGTGVAYGINGNGDVTGWSSLAGGAQHAFRFTSGAMADLGVLPGASFSQGRAINLKGDVVGYSGSAGTSSAFLAIGNRPLLDLGSLPFASSSAAFGLNDARVVVGQVTYSSGPSHGFVWDPQTARMYDLNDLISVSSSELIVSAAGVNNATQIVGTALVNGALHAVVLTPDRTPFLPFTEPVPEPGSWLLLGLGAAGVAAGRMFRRGRRAGRGGDGPAGASPGR